MQNITIKELRDKKVDCSKAYLLFKASHWLYLAGEREIIESVHEAIESLDAYPDPYLEWMEIFNKYNKENNSEFDMACMSCWDKVLDWAIENKKIDV